MIDTIRIDKWLWAARFFKKRSLAKTAIENGRIRIDGSRVKASKLVGRNSLILIKRQNYDLEVIIIGLRHERRPANEAQLLYSETEKSKKMRQDKEKNSDILFKTKSLKPDKKDRRLIQKYVKNVI